MKNTVIAALVASSMTFFGTITNQETQNNESKFVVANQSEIQIEVQNTSKSQIFVKYEGSIRGSSFLGAGTVTRYKAKPGDKILDKKTGAVLVSVTASTKANHRFKI
ncbi:MAG: hypothetical protein EAZ85_05045 [Bacteroidetes bacterium]|nr:MAG: hypothetical protein EAZ85_05045 [Bacteroidota bacterium]TAG85754.1 MAG: hypothetical protein EAZ20_14270 [Bacteroidota bacterium]